MTDTQKIEALITETPAIQEAFEALQAKTKKAEELMAAALVREELVRAELAQLKAEKRSELSRIADELRKFAEAQGDPSGWISVIALAVETEWSALNDPSAFAKVPCRFAVEEELAAAKAENARLREAAQWAATVIDVYIGEMGEIQAADGTDAADTYMALTALLEGGE